MLSQKIKYVRRNLIIFFWGYGGDFVESLREISCEIANCLFDPDYAKKALL